MSSVSDIKLIRTDTTLDLSQKAEKRWRTSSLEEGWFLFPTVEIWWPENCRFSSFCCIAGGPSLLARHWAVILYVHCTSEANREQTSHSTQPTANWKCCKS